MTDEQLNLFPDLAEIELENILNPCIRVYGTGPQGTKCKTCKHLYGKRWNRVYYKCELRRDTNGPGTDHRVNWQSCGRYEEEVKT